MTLSRTATLFAVAALVVMALAAVAAPSASAQGLEKPAAVTPSVGGTTWSGSETLPGYGPLSFTFTGDGKAAMRDAVSLRDNNTGRVAMGSWTQNGMEVEIRFNDCVYRGRINAGAMTGTAQFTSGQAQTWEFQLRVQPAQPQGNPAPAPAPAPRFSPEL